MRAEPLTSERLSLEPLRVDHAEEMAVVLADPELYTFTGGLPPRVEQLRARYERQVVGRSPDGEHWWMNWVVRLRAEPYPAVGFVQATVSADLSRAELAWVIGSGWQRRGIAGEAAQLVAGFLVAGQSAEMELIAHIHPDHHASATIAHRLGMTPTPELVEGERCWSTDVEAAAPDRAI